MASFRSGRRGQVFAGLAIGGLVALTAACSSSTKDSGTPAAAPGSASGAGSSGASGSGASGSDIVAAAKAAVEKASGPNGTYVLPEPGPKAQKGKKVFVITCGAAADACQVPAVNVQQAGASLDWNVTIVDGKLSAAGYDAGIRQAIAAKADGIVVVAIDCTSAKNAFLAAKAANIPVVGVYAYDCNDPMVGGPKLFAATINSNGDPDAWAIANSQLRADYAIAKTDGKAKVISLNQPDFLVAKYWSKGFNDELAKCSSCKISAAVDFTSNDLVGGGAPQKLATVLLKYPDANVLFVTSDALLQAVLPSIRNAHRPDLIVIANEGFAATQQLIRSGTVSAAVGIYSPWMGWSGADALNRVLAGQPTIPNEGLGYHLLTKDNLPSGTWAPSLDYQAAFKKMWAGA